MMLSICVLTYNHEKYVEECIKSILKQKINFQFEILIGDDCSSDKTLMILGKYTDKITVISRDKNLGLCLNMYDLRSRANGKYIFFMSGDDYLSDEVALQEHVDFLESYPQYYMVTGWGDMFNQQQGILLTNPYDTSPRVFTLREFLSNGIVPTLQGTMRNTFREEKEELDYLYKGAKNNEEMKMWMYILTHGDVYILPKKFYVYRYVNSEVASNYNSTHSLIEMFQDYYTDIKLMRSVFGKKYQFKPAIMHKANSFCIMFSENIKDLMRFIKVLEISDLIGLVLYKVYLKLNKYEDPSWWKKEKYLIKEK